MEGATYFGSKVAVGGMAYAFGMTPVQSTLVSLGVTETVGAYAGSAGDDERVKYKAVPGPGQWGCKVKREHGIQAAAPDMRPAEVIFTQEAKKTVAALVKDAPKKPYFAEGGVKTTKIGSTEGAKAMATVLDIKGKAGKYDVIVDGKTVPMNTGSIPTVISDETLKRRTKQEKAAKAATQKEINEHPEYALLREKSTLQFGIDHSLGDRAKAEGRIKAIDKQLAALKENPATKAAPIVTGQPPVVQQTPVQFIPRKPKTTAKRFGPKMPVGKTKYVATNIPMGPLHFNLGAL